MSGRAEDPGGDVVRAADAVCRTLDDLGVECVFGLPGTQNLDLTEALRTSDLQWVVPCNELSAAFMANGHFRASGRPGVLTTIPGPGFTWALTGLAEALLDSAAVLCLTGVHPGDSDGGRFRLQEIPQARIAEPLVKQVFRVRSADELPGRVERAYRATTEGEPGPVLLEIESPVWSDVCSLGAGVAEPDGSRGGAPAPPRSTAETGGETIAVKDVARRLRESSRPLLLAGQGGQEAAEGIRRLAETLGSPILLSTSGRGVVPESHPLAVAMDAVEQPLETLNRLVDTSDLVLVLGCKLGHNATLGFRVRLPAEKLVRVDASAGVLESEEYPASLSVTADVGELVEGLLQRWGGENAGKRTPWWPEELGPDAGSPPEGDDGAELARVPGYGGAADLFSALRRALPDDACLVTDSGLHQMLARRHFPVQAPRSLVTPTNFQSMGYGIPAAVGAALARPSSSVVAVVGDGGLRLSAFELSTARSIGVDLTVLVFVDGHYGLIRRQQLTAFGRGSGVDLPELDLAALSAALGVEHLRLGRSPENELETCLREGGVRIVEVPLEDPGRLRLDAFRARLGEDARRVLGAERMERLRQWRSQL